MTVKFIQLESDGTGNLFGLTADGDVFQLAHGRNVWRKLSMEVWEEHAD